MAPKLKSFMSSVSQKLCKTECCPLPLPYLFISMQTVSLELTEMLGGHV